MTTESSPGKLTVLSTVSPGSARVGVYVTSAYLAATPTTYVYNAPGGKNAP